MCDLMNLGATVSVRSLVRLGSSMAVSDFLHLGATVSLRSCSRLGFSIAAFGMVRFGPSMADPQSLNRSMLP